MGGIRHIWQFKHGYFKSVEVDGAPSDTAFDEGVVRLVTAIRTAFVAGAREGPLVADTGEPIVAGAYGQGDYYAAGGSQYRFEVRIPLADVMDGPVLGYALTQVLGQKGDARADMGGRSCHGRRLVDRRG